MNPKITRPKTDHAKTVMKETSDLLKTAVRFLEAHEDGATAQVKKHITGPLKSVREALRGFASSLDELL